jgi:hypothetical protein
MAQPDIAIMELIDIEEYMLDHSTDMINGAVYEIVEHDFFELATRDQTGVSMPDL